jgi:RHS repeat-associated protein
MLDAVGLVHMNARLYDPEIARFLQADPMITDPSNPQDFNAWTYVRNNPLGATDPTGMFYVGRMSAPTGYAESYKAMTDAGGHRSYYNQVLVPKAARSIARGQLWFPEKGTYNWKGYTKDLILRFYRKQLDWSLAKANKIYNQVAPPSQPWYKKAAKIGVVIVGAALTGLTAGALAPAAVALTTGVLAGTATFVSGIMTVVMVAICQADKVRL